MSSDTGTTRELLFRGYCSFEQWHVFSCLERDQPSPSLQDINPDHINDCLYPVIEWGHHLISKLSPALQKMKFSKTKRGYNLYHILKYKGMAWWKLQLQTVRPFKSTNCHYWVQVTPSEPVMCTSQWQSISK